MPNGLSFVEVVVKLGPEAGVTDSISSLQTSIKQNDGELQLSNGASAKLISVGILTPGTWRMSTLLDNAIEGFVNREKMIAAKDSTKCSSDQTWKLYRLAGILAPTSAIPVQRSNNLELASQLYWELVRNLPGKDNNEYRKNPGVTTSLLRTR